MSIRVCRFIQGPRTVVQPRGYKNVIITIERIIEHCMQSHLTDKLLDALLTLDLETHTVLYAGVAFSTLIQQLFNFLEWLKQKVRFLDIITAVTLQSLMENISVAICISQL